MMLKMQNILCLVLIFLFVAGGVFAGTTGKIAGRITDAQTNEPLPGVNIVIEDSNMGAATNVNGDYSIINIPPGIYSVRVSMMGYASTIVQDVRVSIDLTTPVSVELAEEVLEGEEVTIVAERPLVKMDMTSSLSSVSSEEINNLPVQSINDVLELQAGIVRSGGALHIRGGRSGEVAYWVDGVATTDVFSGGMGVTVENSAVEELQVVSGTFNAEYGKAMSGIINIITKEGGNKLTGKIEGYVGDYVSNASQFQVIDKVSPVLNPETGGITGTESSHTNPLAELNPIYNLQGSLNGPIIKDKLSFFVNARYINNNGYLYGREWFTPQGIPGDSSLVSLNPYNRLSTQAKLTWRVSPAIKVNYNFFWNEWSNDRTFSKDWRYVPDSQAQQFGSGTTHILTMNHVLSNKTFYELRLNRFVNTYQSYVYADPTASVDYLVSVPEDTSLGLVAHTFDPSTPEGKAEIQQLNDLRASYSYIINPDTRAGYVHPDSVSAPASYSFNNVGMNMSHYKRQTSYWVGKWDLTSQVNQAHQLKIGVEGRLNELELKSFDIKPAVDENGTQIVPFIPAVPDESSLYRSQYVRNPIEFSAYIQDKMEFKDLIINLGLRYDYFDANSVVIADPEDPNIYYPFKDDNIFKEDGSEYTPDERRDFMHKDNEVKMQISPRLGIAYPITDQGVIHFSYGHFFQIPEFRFLYDNPDFKISSGGGYYVMGNANLNPQKTVMYEIGLQQQITDNLGIDVTLFYRDVRDWVGTSPLIDTPNPAVKYSQYENKDYSNVRGITFKLEKRYSNNFSARMDYSYQVAEGTYSNPIDAFNSLQNQEEPRLNLIPMGWDQRHTLNGSIVYSINDWTFSAIGRLWTGRPYTPSFARGEFVGGSAVIGLKENSARLPNQKSADLYINKRFRFNAFGLNVFCNIYNLFDTRDESSVYGDTGSADYTTNIDPARVSYDSGRIGTVKDFVLQPTWYTQPREVQLGLSFEF